MSELTNTEFVAKVASSYPDNGAGAITEEILRSQQDDIPDSFDSSQLSAGGEWIEVTPQIITTGSRLSVDTLRLEDRPKTFTRPLWDVANDLIDLQFTNSFVDLEFEFTATALANNTTLFISIRDSVTLTEIRGTTVELPKTSSQSYQIALPFTLIPADATAVANKFEIFLSSDGTVSLEKEYLNLKLRRKRGTV
jgi:hypothetical protein